MILMHFSEDKFSQKYIKALLVLAAHEIRNAGPATFFKHTKIDPVTFRKLLRDLKLPVAKVNFVRENQYYNIQNPERNLWVRLIKP